MSKVDITLEFDRPNHTYYPGETVTGRINILVNQEMQCETLKLYVEWRTKGRGSRDSKQVHEITYEEDVFWPVGSNLSYPVEFELSNLPLSYSGRYITLEWQVTAEVDLPRRIDKLVNVRMGNPKEMIVLNVVPRHNRLRLHSQGPQFMFGGGRFGWIVFVGFFAVFLGFGAQTVFESWIPLVVIILLLALFILQRFLRNRYARSLFDDVEVEFEQDGAQLRVGITPLVKNRINVSAISGEFVIEEIAVNRSGTSSTTYRHTAHSSKNEVFVGRELSNFEQSKFDLLFEVPPNPPSTFKYHNNSVNWHVTLEIPIMPLIKWRQRYGLNVSRLSEDDLQPPGDFDSSLSEDYGGFDA